MKKWIAIIIGVMLCNVCLSGCGETGTAANGCAAIEEGSMVFTV